MTIKERNPVPPEVDRLPIVLDVFGRAMSAVMMFLGLRHWAVILGVIAGAGGMFESMTTPWQLATIHLAVVDLVASVGLWQRVAWGNVVWIYAALAEIAMHTIFAATFGADYLIVGFHVLTICGFVFISILSRKTRVSQVGSSSH